MTDLKPTSSAENFSGATPYRLPILIALIVIVAGGGVLVFSLLDTSQKSRGDGQQRETVDTKARQDAKPTRHFDPIGIAVGFNDVGQKLMAGADELSREEAKRLAAEKARLDARRQELARAKLDTDTLRASIAAAKTLVELKAAFGMPVPSAAEFADDSAREAAIAAVLENPAAYVDFKNRLVELIDAVAGTESVETALALQESVQTVIDTARDSRLATLHTTAEQKIAASEYAAALAVFSPEQFPRELIPTLGYLSPEEQQAYRENFYQTLKLNLLPAVILHHHRETVAAGVEAGDGAAVREALVIDGTLAPLVAEWPAADVEAQLHAARQRALAPFEARFAEMANAARAISPSTAEDVPAALARMAEIFAPVDAWGLDDFSQRAHVIRNSATRRFERKFGTTVTTNPGN